MTAEATSPAVAERPPADPDEAELVAALRRGEDGAFERLVDAYGPALLSLARAHVSSRAAAEDVVQETWLGVLRGIDRFEGRSSLRSWIFRILTNNAKTRGTQDRRTVPFSSVPTSGGDDAPGDPDRILGPSPRHAGRWLLRPAESSRPDESLLRSEAGSTILHAIDRLGPTQREVIALRDVRGWSSREVCAALEISPENQRVLLHRARAKVRAAVETHVGPIASAA